jgi:hypothetical protein
MVHSALTQFFLYILIEKNSSGIMDEKKGKISLGELLHGIGVGRDAGEGRRRERKEEKERRKERRIKGKK